MDDEFSIIVFSGGGSRGIAQLGSLHYFYEKKLYDPKKIKTYAGTSIGSVNSLLLVCGFTPFEIFTKLYSIDNFFGINIEASIWNIIKDMGLTSIDGFVENITKIVKERLHIDYIPTLKELEEITGKRLITVATNISKSSVEYFSAKTTPDILCTTAVKLSCNIPFLFQRVKYNDDYYVDGCLVNNLPIDYVDVPIKKYKILAITTEDNKTNHILANNSFFSYFYTILNIYVQTNTRLRYKHIGENITLINIFCDNGTMNFILSEDDKMELFLRGYSTSKMEQTSELLSVKIENI